VWVVNDTLETLKGKVTLTAYDYAGTALGTFDWDAEVPANGAVQLGEPAEDTVVGSMRAEGVYVRLTAEGFDAPANGYFLRDHKDLALPTATIQVTAGAGKDEVVVSASGGLARMVKLELPASGIRFSDNYFDLLPG